MHPQQLLLQRPDEPLGDAVALGAIGKAGAGLDPEEIQLLLEPVADVLWAVVMPQSQAFSDAFGHGPEVGPQTLIDCRVPGGCAISDRKYRDCIHSSF